MRLSEVTESPCKTGDDYEDRDELTGCRVVEEGEHVRVEGSKCCSAVSKQEECYNRDEQKCEEHHDCLNGVSETYCTETA